MTHIFRIRHKLAPSYLLPNFRSVSEAHTHNTRGSGFNFVLSRELSLSPTSFVFLLLSNGMSCPTVWSVLPSIEFSSVSLKSFSFLSMTDYLLLYGMDFILFMTTELSLRIDFQLSIFHFYFYQGTLWKKVIYRLSWAILRNKLLHFLVYVFLVCFRN